VFGFRPSFGVVPASGEDVWLPSQSTAGPMARNVTDLALLLSVQAGYDPRAPLSDTASGQRFTAPLGSDVKGKRIAWLGDFAGYTPCEDGVLDTCRAALKIFEDLGCTVEEALPEHPFEPVWQAFQKIRQWQSGGGFRILYNDARLRALLKPEAVWEVEQGAKLSAYDVLNASIQRTSWSNAVRRLFAKYDYLIAPTAQVFPFAIEETWPRQVGGHTMQTYHEWMKANCLVTMSGCPALAVPAGFGPQGLPMGLQIIAPVHHEMDCLKLAHAYEKAAPWIARHPPLL
jgi:amidase